MAQPSSFCLNRGAAGNRIGGGPFVQLEHGILQTVTIGGIHLLDGQAGPGFISKFQGHRFAVPLRDIDSVDFTGSLVILRRSGFLNPVLSRNEVGKNCPAIRPGYCGERLSGLEGRGIGAKQGRLDGCPA